MQESNHILNQMIKDENNENKPKLFEFINTLYKTYLNTLNNEKEHKYLNVEDERVILDSENKYIYANELGMVINGMHFGNCKRSLYFKLTGAIKNDTEVCDIESIERNVLIKDQWIKKIKFADLYKEIEEKEFSHDELGPIKLHSSGDGIIMDYIQEKESVLLIKPVNDTAFSVKERVFHPKKGNPLPMVEHLPEVIALLLIHKKPVKLVYVGKNRADEYSEFQIGVKDGILVINGEKYDKVELRKIYVELKNIQIMFTENLIPPRDYMRTRPLTTEEILALTSNGIITNYYEENDLMGGKPYTPFRCSVCKYKTICDSLSDGWVNPNED